MTVPYSFANATVSIPLSQLDSNFNTPITLGNTAIQLGNTVTTLNNMTLANVTISSGNVTITNVSVTTANVTTANITNMVSGNVAITGGSINGTTLGATTASTANVTTLTTSSTVTINGGTVNGVAYLNASKVLTTGSALTFNGTRFSTYVTSDTNTNIARFGVVNSAVTDDAVLDISADAANNLITLNSTGNNAGAFAFQTGNSEQMRLTSTGLGIGTSSPGAKLNTAAAYGVEQIRVQRTSATAEYGSIRYGSNGYDFCFDSVDVDNSLPAFAWRTSVDGTNFAQRMYLDSSGNLGLGVTPSAWNLSGLQAMQIKNASLAGYLNNAYLSANAFFAGGWLYVGNGLASQYVQADGEHRWSIAASGTAGNAISFTQAMTLDASGNLGVGATSITGVSGYQIIETRGSTGGIYQTSASGNSVRSRFYSTSEGGFVGTPSNHFLGFITNDTERARITSGGDLFLGATTSALNGTRFLSFTDANQSAITARCTNGSLGNDVLLVRATRNTTNNSYSAISYYNDGAGAYRFIVADSGNVTNTNGSYGTISDAKMKTDIVDAGSQWADIKAIRFRKFKMKNDSSRFVQLGVVAQELEQTSPGLVEEHSDKDAEGNDLGTTTKSVKTSVLLMKAAVALQEAMARIETLEAKIAALEAK
jgi:hypothetical protein